MKPLWGISINKLFRSADWWNYIFPPVLGIAYLQIFMFNRSFGFIYTDLILFFSSFIGTAGFGFILNDITDINEDKLAGKKNYASGLSVFNRMLFLFLSLVISILPWIFITYDQKVVALFFLQLILLILYSSNPVRLKRFKYASIITDALYSSVIPTLIAFTLFSYGEQNYNNYCAILLLVFLSMFFRGARNIITHQLVDIEHDKIINAKTIVVANGEEKTRFVIGVFFIPVEIFFFFLFLVFLINAIGFNLVFLTVFVFLLLIYIFSTVRISTKNNFLHYLINDFYGDFLPLYFLIVLALCSKFFIIILVLHFFMFRKKPIYLFSSYLIVHFVYHRMLVWLYFKMFHNKYIKRLIGKNGE